MMFYVLTHYVWCLFAVGSHESRSLCSHGYVVKSPFHAFSAWKAPFGAAAFIGAGGAAFIAACAAGGAGLIGTGWAGDVLPGPIDAEVVEVIDGDTISVRARVWLDQDVNVRVRLDGVDAPELRGRCPAEKRLARQARDFMKAETDGKRVVLSDVRYGKFAGRVVARVGATDEPRARAGKRRPAPNTRDLGEALVNARLARPYRGGKRGSWCGE